jgi:hypothetical protein
MTMLFQSPDGVKWLAVPQRWSHQGKVHDFGGHWPRARRAGWIAIPTPLPDVREEALEANRTECTRRILAALDQDPQKARDKQTSIALGLYGEEARQAWAGWVGRNIDAENAAAEAIQAADSHEKVAAVAVAWPVWSGGRLRRA